MEVIEMPIVHTILLHKLEKVPIETLLSPVRKF